MYSNFNFVCVAHSKHYLKKSDNAYNLDYLNCIPFDLYFDKIWNQTCTTPWFLCIFTVYICSEPAEGGVHQLVRKEKGRDTKENWCERCLNLETGLQIKIYYLTWVELIPPAMRVSINHCRINILRLKQQSASSICHHNIIACNTHYM